MDIEPTLLSERDANDADSLVSTNDPDTTGNEQTWPTEEEMQDAEAVGPASEASEYKIPDAKKGTTPRRVRRIPKGMSEYQASWIVDEDDEEGEDDGGDGAGAGGSDVGMDGDAQEQDDEEAEEEMVDMPAPEDDDGDGDMDMDTASRKSVAFKDLDMEEESRQCVFTHYPNLYSIS